MGRLNNEERSSLLHHASLLQQIATAMKGKSFKRWPGQTSYATAATLEQAVEFLLSLEAENSSNGDVLYKRWG